MILGISMLNNISTLECFILLWCLCLGQNNSQLVDHECKHMTLGISTLINILLLHTKLEHKTNISSTPTCYIECHVVKKHHIKKLCMLTFVVLTTSIGDISRPSKNVVWFFVNSAIHDSKYHNQFTLFMGIDLVSLPTWSYKIQ